MRSNIKNIICGGLIIVTSILIYGKFAENKAPQPIVEYKVTTTDSLSTVLIDQLTKLQHRMDTFTNTTLLKQKKLDEDYNKNVNNIEYIDGDDELLQSIIYLTD